MVHSKLTVCPTRQRQQQIRISTSDSSALDPGLAAYTSWIQARKFEEALSALENPQIRYVECIQPMTDLFAAPWYGSFPWEPVFKGVL
jgi:hypothetical protein